MPSLKSHQVSDNPRPTFEATLRYGVSSRADLGVKMGPVHAELNSLVALWQQERLVLSILPALHMSWLVEEPRVFTIHMSRTATPLEGFEHATRVTAVRLPGIVGLWNRSGHWGLVTGPTVHAGYRGCQGGVRTAGDDVYSTCTASDKGPFVAAGFHFGLRVSVGQFVRLAPELSFVRTVMGPEARLVRYESVRRYMSQGDTRLQFAFGVHVGNFSNSPRAKWKRELRKRQQRDKTFFFQP